MLGGALPAAQSATACGPSLADPCTRPASLSALSLPEATPRLLSLSSPWLMRLVCVAACMLVFLRNPSRLVTLLLPAHTNGDDSTLLSCRFEATCSGVMSPPSALIFSASARSWSVTVGVLPKLLTVPGLTNPCSSNCLGVSPN